MKSAFLSLPPELHTQIGQYLSLHSLARLSCTNRTVSSFYLHNINQRLSTVLPLFIAGREPELVPALPCDPTCIRRFCKVEYGALCPALLDNFPDADESTHPWFLRRLWEYIISRLASERVQKILVASGCWTDPWAMVISLAQAVEHCRSENIRQSLDKDRYRSEEGIRTVEMMASQVAHLIQNCAVSGASDPRSVLLYSPAEAAMQHSRPRCLRILYSHGLCPGKDERREQTELLFAGLQAGLSLHGYSRHTLEMKWEVLEFAVHTVGCDISRFHIYRDATTGWSLLEQFARNANAVQDIPKKGELSNEELYMRILGLFKEAGVTGPAPGHEGWYEVPDPVVSYPPAVRAFLRAGFCTDSRWGRDGATGYLHRFAVFRDFDEVELIYELALEQGCPVDVKDSEGNTPLCLMVYDLAVCFGTPEMSENSYENYPSDSELQVAYSQKELEEQAHEKDYLHSDRIRYFLRKGADPFIRNTAGFAPITIALHLGWKHLIDDMVQLDSRRQERYGEMSARQVWDKWVQNDVSWWRNLLGNGTWLRYELEPQIVKLPQLVTQDEIDYLELEGREDDSPYRFPRGQIVYDP